MKPVDPGSNHGVLINFAETQEEYETLPSRMFDLDIEGDGFTVKAVRTHWVLTDEDLKNLELNRVIELDVITYGRPIQPLMMRAVE